MVMIPWQTKLDSLMTGKSVANRHKPSSLSVQPQPHQRLPSQREHHDKNDSLQAAMTADPAPSHPTTTSASPRHSSRISSEPAVPQPTPSVPSTRMSGSFTNHNSIFNSGLSVVMADPSRPRQPALAASDSAMISMPSVAVDRLGNNTGKGLDSTLRLDSYREADNSSNNNNSKATGVKKTMRIARSSSSNSNFEGDNGIAIKGNRRSGEQLTVSSAGRDQVPLIDRVLI
mmetsp:Transcript_1664/g.2324  ORF Transcript_1664/g.2324 Transcript_1664/m.2324 type:complete len:230 (-) Transcript_1664:162-851(-)